MADKAPDGVHSLKQFDDPDAALARIADIYETGVRRVRERFDAFAAGDRTSPSEPAFYPYARVEAGATLFSGFDEGQLFRRWIDRHGLSREGSSGATLTPAERPPVDFLFYSMAEFAAAVGAGQD